MTGGRFALKGEQRAVPHPALIAAPIAAALHLGVLISRGSPLTLRGAVLVELLAAASLLVFLAIRRSGKTERKIASISIFVSSLVLALTAPAALLPAAANRGEAWAVVGSQTSVATSAGIFALWSASFLIGGLAMHGLTNRRWKLLKATATPPSRT